MQNSKGQSPQIAKGLNGSAIHLIKNWTQDIQKSPVLTGKKKSVIIPVYWGENCHNQGPG